MWVYSQLMFIIHINIMYAWIYILNSGFDKLFSTLDIMHYAKLILKVITFMSCDDWLLNFVTCLSIIKFLVLISAFCRKDAVFFTLLSSFTHIWIMYEIQHIKVDATIFFKGHHHKSEKIIHRMGENSCKSYICWGTQKYKDNL